MGKVTSVCPYYGGVTQKGTRYLLKCGNDHYSFEIEEQANFKASNECKNQMDNCRPFLFRQLTEMGVSPTSEWTTEQLREEYLKQKDTGGNGMNEVATAGNNQLATRSPLIIAAEINSIKEQTRKMVLYNSIEIGRRLVEAKSMIDHGEWGSWLEQYVEYSQRTANNLMRIFEEFGSNQLALFDNNAKSQALANLSYTQAVALLGVPEEDREKFLEENDIEKLSTRELQQVIKERDEALKKLSNANKAVERIAEDRDKLREEAESLRTNVQTTDLVLKDTQDSVKRLQEALDKERQRTKSEVERLTKLLNEARANGSSDELINQLKEELKEAQDQVHELTEKIKEPITIEPAVIEKIPEEVEKELAELREKTKELEEKTAQQSDPVIRKFGAQFESLVNGFDVLLKTLSAIKDTNKDIHEKYKAAVYKVIGMMSERL